MFAYVLYRKDFKYRNQLAFFTYFTTLFSGGMVAQYIIIIRYLNLKNTVWILLLGGLFSVFNILILRNFMNGTIPESLVESARIDGANEFTTFIRIVLPLMKPALACIGLFHALNVWNDWTTAMLYISKKSLYPLQYYLYQIMRSAENAASAVTTGVAADVHAPRETVKLAMIVVATGPIVLLYPFVQKYFVKGITIGAVKG
jgi:putative aldouronate transport system permease protein